MKRCEDMICTVSFRLGAWTLRMEEALVWGPCWSKICTQRQFSWWWKTTSTMTGSLKNVVFVLSCLQSSSGEWLSRARKATSNRSAPTLTSLSTSSDPPRQLLLWRHSRGACSSRPGAIAGQLLERESIRQREGGILHLASSKQGRSHSYILINL